MLTAWCTGLPRAKINGGLPWKKPNSDPTEVATALLERLPFDIKGEIEWRIEKSGDQDRTILIRNATNDRL